MGPEAALGLRWGGRALSGDLDKEGGSVLTGGLTLGGGHQDPRPEAGRPLESERGRGDPAAETGRMGSRIPRPSLL